MNIVKAWEGEFFKGEHEGVRKVALRIAIVLGNEHGALPKLKSVTKMGLGGKQGKGNQMVSWIHLEDVCRAVEFIIESGYLEGPINLAAPIPLKNKHFMEVLRAIYKPWFYINQPAWLLELGALFLRTETELILKSRYVLPERLTKAGFQFKFANVETALLDLSDTKNIDKVGATVLQF